MAEHSTVKVPTLEALTLYLRKGVGVDMALKSVLGVFRLMMIYSGSNEDKAKWAALVDSIIECRMLCNFGKHFITLSQGVQRFNAPPDHFGFYHWLFLCLSYFLRAPEQLSGDLNFLQKVIIHRWSRKRLSFFYRFFKSFSLTCCLLVEILKRPHLRAALKAAKTDKDIRTASAELNVSNVLAVRTACDMYVYYKWIPGYTPIPTLEYICGSVSGLLGVWLVWKDTRYRCCSSAEAAPMASPTANSSGEMSVGCIGKSYSLSTGDVDE